MHDWSDPPLHWGIIDPDYQNWTCDRYIAALRDSAGRDHFDAYMRAIAQCDAAVLLLPAGTDAHCEALAARMLDKPTIVCFADGRPQRELAHCAFELFAVSVDDLMTKLATVLPVSTPADGLTDDMMLHPEAEDRGA